ncbi:TetR/AcrR family transcriptional regulator [Bradyrhizobium sp. Leo170]|nr:TetR/AcrR family transcriptional regulator [Bradyrhizobium sp. Leo170]
MRKLDPVKHENKRQEILTAAMRCFLRSGLKGASTAQICSEAKISPGHLYHYFESKEAIIGALSEAYLQTAAERFRAAVGGDRSVINAILSEMDIQAKGSQPAKLALLFEVFAESARNPEIAKILRTYDLSRRGVMAEVLRHGQRRGEIDPKLDPEAGATAVIGLVDAAKAMTLRASRSDVKKVQDTFKSILTGLLRSPTQKATKSTPPFRSRP